MENIERKIEDDIEELNNRKEKKKMEKGDKVTKAVILEATQCDNLRQVQAVSAKI